MTIDYAVANTDATWQENLLNLIGNVARSWGTKRDS